MKNKEIIEEFRKLYGDDFRGGCRDKYANFILKALSQQKEEIEKEVEERISKIEQIRCDEMLRKQKEEIKKEVKLWFNMFMVDKSVRIDVRGITCLKDLLRRLRKL